MRTGIWMLAAALIAVPAGAQVTSTQASGPAAKVKDDSERLICKRQEVIGSLIAKKRVCATKRVWDLTEENAQDNLKVLTAPGAFAPSG